MFKFNFKIENNSIDEISVEKQGEPKLDLVETNENSNKADEEEELNETCGLISYDQMHNELNEDETICFKRLSLNLESKTGETFIDYVDSYQVKIDENNLISKINKTHDLVPGKYEGGLKVWELSIDLSRLIYNVGLMDLDSIILNDQIKQELKSIQDAFRRFLNNYQQTEIKILELGCGHGLPSFAAVKLIQHLFELKSDELKLERKLKIKIYLQDFNKEILERITYENAKKFIQESENGIDTEFYFVYGDWRLILKEKLLPQNYFNLILTSETIYNQQNYKHLLDLIRACLLEMNNDANENGDDDDAENHQVSDLEETELGKIALIKRQTQISVCDEDEQDHELNKSRKKLKTFRSEESSFVLLSAKTYYFGCGGNLHEFLRVAESSCYKFKSSENLLFFDNLELINSANKNEATAANIDGKELLLAQICRNDQTQIELQKEAYDGNNSKCALTTTSTRNSVASNSNSVSLAQYLPCSIAKEIVKLSL